MENLENWSYRLILATHHGMGRGRGSRLALEVFDIWDQDHYSDCPIATTIILLLCNYIDQHLSDILVHLVGYRVDVHQCLLYTDHHHSSIMSEINVTAVLYPKPEKFDEVGLHVLTLTVPI